MEVDAPTHELPLINGKPIGMFNRSTVRLSFFFKFVPTVVLLPQKVSILSC